jgi:hypothetical protein
MLSYKVGEQMRSDYGNVSYLPTLSGGVLTTISIENLDVVAIRRDARPILIKIKFGSHRGARFSVYQVRRRNARGGDPMTTAKGPPAPAKTKRFRERAEECRALAGMMTCAANAAIYLKFAETFERLAEQEEWLGATFNIKTSG